MNLSFSHSNNNNRRVTDALSYEACIAECYYLSLSLFFFCWTFSQNYYYMKRKHAWRHSYAAACKSSQPTTSILTIWRGRSHAYEENKPTNNLFLLFSFFGIVLKWNELFMVVKSICCLCTLREPFTWF